MKTSVSLAVFFLAITSLAAQTVPPALMVEENGRSSPLGLSKVQTEVRILGSVAETSTTMTFTNSTARVLEGDLYFPLPEGATISGYALDINGVMVDGVAVEKHEARRVFEEVVRRGIDPGLVEWTKGNNFQTRVFPIPARGSRTIRVEYVSELLGGRDAPAYHLPLAFKEKLAEFSLRVEVVKPTAPPKIAKGELTNFAFEKWRESYVAQTRQQDWSAVEDLIVALPKTDQPQIVLERADDNQVYFAIHDEPALPAAETPGIVAKHAVVFWDASGSRAGDHAREIAVFQGYLNRLLPQRVEGQEPKILLDLVFIRNEASKPIRLEYTQSNPAALVTLLGQVPYDGGTQFGAIAPLAGPRPDLYLLFTDGISNFGREEPARLDAPLFIFSASPSANHAFLHSLAMASGGRYFNLATWKDADLLAQAGRSAWSFLSASIEGGEVKDLYPQQPQPLAGRFTLVGKLTGPSATVTVNYGIPGGKADQRSFQVSAADAVPGSLLRRLWAQKKLAELLIHQKQNEKEITALGKQFGLVTPYTSLLVLDTLEQYVQYEVTPPKSLPAMREEYQRRIDTLEHQKAKQKADKLAEVLRLWEERVKWWNTEFKYPKDFRYKEVEKKSSATGGEAKAKQFPGYGWEGPPPRPARAAQARPETKAAEAPAMHNPQPAAEPSQRQAAAGEEPPIINDPTLLQGDLGGRMKDRKDSSGQSAGQPGISIMEWNPDTPYLKELRAAKGKGDLFAIYMKNRAQLGASPSFFLDCADFFREAGEPAVALQVLSNIAELQLEDAALLRVLGYRLLQIGQLDLAVMTFEHVLEMRPEEPQSYRDLALALTRRAEEGSRTDARAAHAIRDDYARAVDLFGKLVMGRWDERFPGIEVIALEELNAIAGKAKAAGVPEIPLDPRLLKLLDVDVRIVMTWQADNTDIDLWVTEPTGEKAMYDHNRTTIGGLVSNDFTQGYGPEEYLVRRAAHGVYKIAANYYGSRATRLLGPVTVQVDVYTNYGRPNQQCKSLTLRLKEAKETVPIGEIEF